MNDLSPAQRKLLQGLLIRLGQDDDAAQFLHPAKSTLLSILEWAQQHYVLQQTPLRGRFVWVSADWLEDINLALVAHGYAPLATVRTGDRIEQARHSVTEVKHLADAPTLHRVLHAVIRSELDSPSDNAIDCSWAIEDVDWRSLQLPQYDNLVVIENLTVFYHLATLRIDWPPRALIVYRGDDRYQQAFSQLLAQWQTLDKACYALVDLDPFSVRMLQAGPYTHVAAPSLTRFKSMASPAHAPAKQHGFAANLVASGAFAPFIEYMLTKQVGLKQEWMHHEPLYWVALH